MGNRLRPQQYKTSDDNLIVQSKEHLRQWFEWFDILVEVYTKSQWIKDEYDHKN